MREGWARLGRMATRLFDRLFDAILVAAGVLVLCGILVFAWGMWQVNRPPFNLTLLERLAPGMTPEEVRAVLGSPTGTHEREWAYSRPLAWPIVYIYFDDSGRYKSSEYDY